MYIFNASISVLSQMPCWYYEKKDLHNTVSRRDGVDEETEARYRREGARFIMDTGTKMGLYPSQMGPTAQSLVDCNLLLCFKVIWIDLLSICLQFSWRKPFILFCAYLS